MVFMMILFQFFDDQLKQKATKTDQGCTNNLPKKRLPLANTSWGPRVAQR